MTRITGHEENLPHGTKINALASRCDETDVRVDDHEKRLAALEEALGIKDTVPIPADGQ
jgi:hypothetical protein